MEEDSFSGADLDLSAPVISVLVPTKKGFIAGGSGGHIYIYESMYSKVLRLEITIPRL